MSITISRAGISVVKNTAIKAPNSVYIKVVFFDNALVFIVAGKYDTFAEQPIVRPFSRFSFFDITHSLSFLSMFDLSL